MALARQRRATRRGARLLPLSAAAQRGRDQLRLARLRHRCADDRARPRPPLRFRRPAARRARGPRRPRPRDAWHPRHPSLPRPGLGRPDRRPVRPARTRPGRPPLDPVRPAVPRRRALFRDPAPAANCNPSAFASVPTALMMLNAQLDGIVALGIGAAVALWSRPYFAGLALGLTLVKPQLVLPLGVGLLVFRRWRVLAGWATVGLVLLAATLVISPHWVVDWLGQTRSTIQTGAREVDLPHFAAFLPSSVQTVGLVGLTLVAIGGALALAARRRKELKAAAAILVIGGVVASPHSLPSDLVVVAVGLAIWGATTWKEWLALSVTALVAALAPDPVPAGVGSALILWLTLRISLWRQGPVPASAR